MEPLRGGFFLSWSALAGLWLLLAAVAVVVRLAIGPQLDGLLMAAAAAGAVLVAARICLDKTETRASAAGRRIKQLLDSAGPMVMAANLEGRFTYVNPAMERVLGYHAPELLEMANAGMILAPDEGARLVHEIVKIAGVHRDGPSSHGAMAEFLESVRALPPSQVPSFDAQMRGKDGATIPVTLHISAMRDSTGALTGMAAVALDRSSTLHQDQALRESQERYRDLFENSTEMIATLSPAGQFLYANPAWKRCFGMDTATLLTLGTFEEVFGLECRAEAGALFRRVLDGEAVDRAPLRNHTEDGRILEFELSLSQRQKAGNPLAVRCLLRDVTQQKSREHRLALQLVVSQIVGENTSPELASMRILEALCVSQDWDVAVNWTVNTEEDQLEFTSAWGAPGSQSEAVIHESMGLKLDKGVDLPGRVWKEGRTLWIGDLADVPSTPRMECARRQEMVSGWAVPVRAGNKILAILEFYCHFRYRENREAIATMETVAASLGQMLARTHERGRAEGLYRQQKILLDSVADGICGVDRRGLVSFANPAAALLLGTEAERLAGKPVHELLHGAAGPASRCDQDCPLRLATGRRRQHLSRQRHQLSRRVLPHADSRPGTLFRFGSQLPRHQSAFRVGPPQGRVHLHGKP
jgi:PAS domain S-box-containing protein